VTLVYCQSVVPSAMQIIGLFFLFYVRISSGGKVSMTIDCTWELLGYPTNFTFFHLSSMYLGFVLYMEHYGSLI
jgi:hypothetical protein